MAAQLATLPAVARAAVLRVAIVVRRAGQALAVGAAGRRTACYKIREVRPRDPVFAASCMRVSRFLLLPLAAAAPAQQQFTSPPNVGNDGDSVVSSLQPFNTSLNGRRFQYITDDVRDVPSVLGEPIARIAMRPDPSAPQSIGRTGNVTLVLDHADFAALGSTFASNYSGNQTAYPLGNVSLPTTTGASGFVITFTLPAPFVYFGVHNPTRPTATALLVEFQTSGMVGGTSYSLDCADGTSGPVAGSSMYYGLQPCVVVPNVGGFDIVKHGPTTTGGQTTIGQHALRGPVSSFGILALGLTDPNTDYGGLLCAPSRASIDAQIGVVSDAQGAIGGFANPLSITFPDLVGIQPLRVYTQFIMADPGRGLPQIGVSLSDAIRFDVTSPVVIDRRTLYSTSSASAATGTLTVQFVPVLRFN